MPENRVVLWHKPSDKVFMLAKYYATTGWYINARTEAQKAAFVDELNEWFATNIESGADGFNIGANYALEYEFGDVSASEVSEDLRGGLS